MDCEHAEGVFMRSLHVKTTLMHQTMVMRTQLHKVIERCSAAIGPMLNVVAVQVASRTAAGETTALIAGEQCAFQRGSNGARLATNVERLAFGIFDDTHNARIARQAANRVRSEVRAVVQMAATIAIVTALSKSTSVSAETCTCTSVSVGLAMACINASARSLSSDVSSNSSAVASFAFRLKFFRCPFNRLDEVRAVLGRQANLDHNHVIVIEMPGQFTALMARIGLLEFQIRLRAPIAAHHGFDVRRSAVFGDHQQVVFVFERCHARHRAHF